MKWLVIAALVFSAAVRQEEAAEAGAAPTTAPPWRPAARWAAAAPRPPWPAASAAACGAVDVPTEQDFEAQATTDVTDKNVDAKLKALEADLSQ